MAHDVTAILPERACDIHPADDATHPANDATSVPHVILVVDDEVLIRMAVAEYLRECGFHVFEAADGEEAVTVLTATDTAIDLVFSDVQMPGMDGFSLARWIREHRPGVQVLLTSGNPTSIAQKATDLCHLGPVEPKPYDHEPIKQRIQRMLARGDQAHV